MAASLTYKDASAIVGVSVRSLQRAYAVGELKGKKDLVTRRVTFNQRNINAYQKRRKAAASTTRKAA